jgi:hypothetical protein
LIVRSNNVCDELKTQLVRPTIEIHVYLTAFVDFWFGGRLRIQKNLYADINSRLLKLRWRYVGDEQLSSRESHL